MRTFAWPSQRPMWHCLPIPASQAALSSPFRRGKPQKCAAIRRKLTLRAQQGIANAALGPVARRRGKPGLFKEREHGEFGQGGPAASAAALTHAQILTGDAPPSAPLPPGSWCESLQLWKVRLEAK